MNVSLTKKLQLYKKQLHDMNMAAKQTQSKQAVFPEQIEFENDREIHRAAEQLGASINYFENQYVLVHTEYLPLDTKIGPYALNDLPSLVQCWQSGYAQHPLSAYGLSPEDLLFFDTETTGLGSGTGQMIFLIGLARLTARGIELKQYFLPGPGHEAAFYDAFLRDCHSLKNLVTFNGKAFDWPRVKTRHQFVRDQVPKLPAFGHFDLLHASRRLWKNRLESVRLQTVEKDILSMGRSEDVPGKMAPFLYFQFLKHPDAKLVKGIIEHNREDVLTLISLYIHLSNKVMGRIECDAEESYEIARWDQQLGDLEHAKQLWKMLSAGNSSFKNQAMLRLAELYKRAGDYRSSLNLFELVIKENDVTDESACIEAAKLLEHQFKDYERAIYYTKRAIECLQHSNQVTKSTDNEIELKYLKRMDRLDQKRLAELS